MSREAEAQRRWRERHSAEAARRAKAQSKALWRLKKRHEEEFRALYREEYEALAVDA